MQTGMERVAFTMDKGKNMTVGKPAQLILTFAIPLIIGNLGQQFYMIVDSIIVGQGVGVKGLAAVGATDWTYWLFLWTIQALTQGFSIPIAQRYGMGDSKGIKKALSMSIILCGIMGLVLGALTEPAPDLAALTPEFAFNLFYLVVFASGVCYVLQNVGLAHVAPAQGSLLLSLESVFGVLASVLLYGEVVTGRMMAGFALIFTAILVSELAPARKKNPEEVAESDFEELAEIAS